MVTEERGRGSHPHTGKRTNKVQPTLLSSTPYDFSKAGVRSFPPSNAAVRYRRYLFFHPPRSVMADATGRVSVENFY